MKHMSLLLIHGLFALCVGQAFAQEPAADSKVPAPHSLTEVANQIQDASTSLMLVLKEGAPELATKFQKDHEFLTKYIAAQKSCGEKESYTTYTCLEKTNPDIAKALPIVQALVSSMGGGVNDPCSKFAKVMDVANKALLLYQGACAAAKALCNSSCGGAATKLKSAKGTLKSVHAEAKYTILAKIDLASATPAGEALAKRYTFLSKQMDIEVEALYAAIDHDLDTSSKLSVASKANTCTGYDAQLASALVGSVGILRSMGEANKCDTATTTSPTPVVPVDCTIEANKKNNQECICKDAPRTPGCPEALDTNLNSKSSDIMRSANAGSYTPNAKTGSGTGADGIAGDLPTGGSDGNSTSSGPGAPVGGNGAGIDGGSGFGGGAGGAAQKSGSGLNTNILAGEGGGGGGGSRGGYGSGSDSGGRGGGLRQFLPGGQRDPAAQQLAGQASVKDVTSQGGKSNWEKVRERYRDNKPTLLGN